MDRDEIMLENVRNVLVEGFETNFRWLICVLTGFFSLFLLYAISVVWQFSNDFEIVAVFHILWIGLIIYLIGLFTLILTGQILKIIFNQILKMILTRSILPAEE